MYEQYINKRYNKWTVLKYSHKDAHNHPYFVCACDCGNICTVDIYSLKYGKSLSCSSCYIHHKKHGLAKSRLYSIFYSMKDRCYNTKAVAYKHYGARGIVVCEEWANDFETFAKWALEHGYSDKLTLDRIDYNKGYCPDNCRWTDTLTQANNKRSNHIIEYNGTKYSIADFCREFQKNERTVRERINRYGITKAEDLLKPAHRLYNGSKIYIKIGNRQQSLASWCRELRVSYSTIINRIRNTTTLHKKHSQHR